MNHDDALFLAMAISSGFEDYSIEINGYRGTKIKLITKHGKIHSAFMSNQETVYELITWATEKRIWLYISEEKNENWIYP